MASMAAKWAAGCTFAHGGLTPEDKEKIPYHKVGQNIYVIPGDTIDMSSVVQMWYNETKDYKYDTLNCTKEKQCGHYTQVSDVT